MAQHRDAVDLGDVDGVPGGVLGDVARLGELGVTGLEHRDRRLEAGLREELERGQHAAVDLVGLDVARARGLEVDARVAQHALLEQRLRHQQDLADREA